MNLRSIGILVTYRCNIECSHCYINCGPHRTGVLELDLAERILRGAKDLGLDGSGIHVGGGETFLYFDRVVEILGIAEQLDMTPLAWVETNCFWCKSDDIVRDRLTTLRDAGAGKIWLSTDPYHQEHVPFENVKRIHRIGVEVLGEEGVIVQNQAYFESPEKWNDVADYIKSFPPMLMGRAYTELKRYRPRKPLAEFVSERCEDQISPEMMYETHINPDGSVMASNCSGVIVGDAEHRSLTDIFHDDDWCRNEVLRTLADKGPVGLLQMARDFQQKETYAQKCELCWEVRSHLAETIPDTFAPVECYSGS
jgi:hypothetical protein